LAVGSALLAALAPKCPLCLAAYLSAFGVTVGAASVVVAVLRPVAVTLAVLSVAFMVLRRALYGGRAIRSGPRATRLSRPGSKPNSCSV
jgi:hypothetical protein